MKFSKTFLNYLIVVLLEQKIDNFEFITTKKKLKIIFKLQFFVTLKQLKINLNLTNWMRNYVFYYVQLTNSLQIRKILILKNSSTKNNARKRFSNNNRLNIFIEIEIIFYKAIQFFFSNLYFLYIIIERVNYTLI